MKNLSPVAEVALLPAEVKEHRGVVEHIPAEVVEHIPAEVEEHIPAQVEEHIPAEVEECILVEEAHLLFHMEVAGPPSSY